MLEFDPIKGTATCPQSGYTRRLEGEQQHKGAASSERLVVLSVQMFDKSHANRLEKQA